MSLSNISFCRYLTEKAKRNDSHWRARNIVRAIKGDAFNGYAELQVGGRTQRLTEDNPELAVTWFVERFASGVKLREGIDYFLVPIPDRKCTVDAGRPSKTMRLANALSLAIPKLAVWDGLRFAHEVPERCRNEALLYSELRVIQDVPNGKVILLDDVCTTGAHVKSAARLLLEYEVGEITAVSVARTALEADERVFGIRKDVL